MSIEHILYAGSVEYVRVDLSANGVLVDQPVDFSFDRTTWFPGSWTGAQGTTRTAEILLGGTVPLPTTGLRHELFVRLTDNPEVPILLAGVVEVR